MSLYSAASGIQLKIAKLYALCNKLDLANLVSISIGNPPYVTLNALNLIMEHPVYAIFFMNLRILCYTKFRRNCLPFPRFWTETRMTQCKHLYLSSGSDNSWFLKIYYRGVPHTLCENGPVDSILVDLSKPHFDDIRFKGDFWFLITLID